MIDTALTKRCDKLPELTGKTGADLLIWITDAAGKYDICRTRHDNLVKAVGG